MKILVTGGAGFIGSNFVYYLLENTDDDVVCLDLLTYAGNLQTLDNIKDNKRYKFVCGDICNKQFIEKLFEEEKFDVVVNFAAESHVDRSILDPSLFLRTNILGVQVLMDACIKFNVNRFHQVSTDEVYGDLPLDRPDLLFTEKTPLKTSSPYSCSKASADLLVHAYQRTYNLNTSISRCSNNYGRYQFPEKLIPLVINNLNNNEMIPVYGTGENVRDWLHVYDHCSAIYLIIKNGKVGEVYNIGGNNERTNLQVVKKLIELSGKDDSCIKYVTDRKGHDLRYAIDASKIRKELGWKPKYDFETGIKETFNWYQANNEWVNNIVSGAYKEYYNKMYGGR